ncbi:MAG TPA: hypothetical protein VFW11_16570 [Cyclobacteriaceae bacterium]|nr:hypothetical protein [Cyclobacteriaceae bacterium]
MPGSEQQFIRICKKQIERKCSFGNGSRYTQRDLERLSAYIKERTGVVISLSTLKRLWKDNYKQSPQMATLDALAVVLDHKDWLSFKQANQKHVSSVVKWATVIAISALTGIIAIWVSLSGVFSDEKYSGTDKKFTTPVRIVGPVFFEASKTVTAGIPNTVIFKYDVSNVTADTIFIQQSWNRNYRIGIDQKVGNAISCIYYESGFHRARLMANDSIIAMRPIHIVSDGWEPHIYYSDDQLPVDFKDEKFIMNGALRLDSAALSHRHIDFSKRFWTRVTNSQVFDVHSDDFSFSTRMKVDRLLNQLCSWMDLIIVTEVHIFSVSLVERGCEKYAAYKLGEIEKEGANNDLAALGCDVYDWQELKVSSQGRSAAIHLNSKLIYQESYKEDMGKIVGLIYIFDGTGSIDYAKLEDGNEQIVFEDNF